MLLNYLEFIMNFKVRELGYGSSFENF